MSSNLLIIGGGIAGLSAGCYALASGYDVTIVEQNIALGGVCTAWPRGAYVVDGCIHWLTGGPFALLYEELGILDRVPLRTLDTWLAWRDVKTERSIAITRDLGALARDLRSLTASASDVREIDRVVRSASRIASLDPGATRAVEIAHFSEQLRSVVDLLDKVGDLVHFRKSVRAWTERFESESLRRFFLATMPPEAPALLVLMILGYLERGWLSRPVGGTAAFRDALIAEYEGLGGRHLLHATVDEILVKGGRASGVRLEDGRMLEGDAVVSTSSMPETVLRLLGGRYDAASTRERMTEWSMFTPIVLASFGVETPLTGFPGMLLVDGIEPFTFGGFENDRLYLRICNDDPSYAPAGHAVVQAMISTSYDWWATRGVSYQLAKDEAARSALKHISRAIPEVDPSRVRMTDVATPLTYWRTARSWRGAYEGWVPSTTSFFGHVKKKLSGLDGFCMAGQWVEPGGGVPTAVMSGRQAVQILCHDAARTFAVPRGGRRGED